MTDQNQQAEGEQDIPPTPLSENYIPDPKDIQENKAVTFLSYIGILCLVPLLLKQDSKFAQFHSKQGLILLIAWFVAWIPLFGWIVGIIAFILSIMGVMMVIKGEAKPLPIVGDFVKKMNL